MPTTHPTAIHHCNPTCHNEVNEFKKSLITWAKNQATGHRTQAAIGNTKKHHDMHTHKSEIFDFMAKYLEGMEIKE